MFERIACVLATLTLMLQGGAKSDCGVSNGIVNINSRTVGGIDAGFGTFPWVAYIKIEGGKYCAGFLVSHSHVVTAAHCVYQKAPWQLNVILGEYVLNAKVEPQQTETYWIRDVAIHPNYSHTLKRYDAAVLTLGSWVNYKRHIGPICISNATDYLGITAWALTWDYKTSDSSRQRTLQLVDLPTRGHMVCSSWLIAKGYLTAFSNDQLCAGYFEDGKTVCAGDPGGPLMIQQDGKWYVIGITIEGVKCADKGLPAIYASMAHVRHWITEIVIDNSEKTTTLQADESSSLSNTASPPADCISLLTTTENCTMSFLDFSQYGQLDNTVL